MRTRLHKGLSQSAGFSMMELIVVMTLIMIMSAAVMPIFRGSLSGVKAEHSRRDVISVLKFAQERAVTDSVEYRFCFDREEGEYWLMRQVDIVKGEKVYEEVFALNEGRRRLAELVSFTRPTTKRDRETGAHYISFFPSGACDVATLRMREEGKVGTITIKTEGKLGRFKVSD